MAGRGAKGLEKSVEAVGVVGFLRQPAPCTIGESRYRRGMFELTRREKVLIAGFIFIFLLGFGVRQWRDSAAFDSRPTQAP